MKTKKEFIEELTPADLEGFMRSEMTVDERMMAFDVAVASNDNSKRFYCIADVDNVFSDMEDCLRAFMRAARDRDADPSHGWFRVDDYGNIYTIGNITDYITDYMDDMAEYMKETYCDELCTFYGYGEAEDDIVAHYSDGELRAIFKQCSFYPDFCAEFDPNYCHRSTVDEFIAESRPHNFIDTAFSWVNSKRGGDYWVGVHDCWREFVEYGDISVLRVWYSPQTEG